ncbi:hypothetical protein HZH68_006429 [Vespula germanica]|uniref:Uncharacterized protein n=1 Tax=Vespula germanica TaxID=30212 RepID=A0A834NB91_VESGE|nr:hypothetical protein HZH68_006429 [Vespula germanica]
MTREVSNAVTYAGFSYTYKEGMRKSSLCSSETGRGLVAPDILASTKRRSTDELLVSFASFVNVLTLRSIIRLSNYPIVAVNRN